MGKSPTVYDVAERAGVSIATVSFAFTQPHRVKETTRNLVLEAAVALGYVPSASARGLAKGRTGALGLYSYDFLSDFNVMDRAGDGGGRSEGMADPYDDFRLFPVYVDEVQRGVQLECVRRGYALMIGGGRNRASGGGAVDIAGRVDGLIIFPQTIPAEITRLLSARIPIVEISEPSHGDGLHHVTVDNASAMRQLTEHLIHVHGLRRLVFVSIPNAETNSRYEGFTTAMRASGLEAPRALESQYANAGGLLISSLAPLLREGQLPEGFVCANDEAALLVMDALKAAGISVPGQVAVTGFDGVVAGRLARPALTTVRQPMEKMGRNAVDILAGALADPGAAPVNRELPLELVLRESCGCHHI
jgi:DNA-binding LacI/PurR family transcriptional regulator